MFIAICQNFVSQANRKSVALAADDAANYYARLSIVVIIALRKHGALTG